MFSQGRITRFQSVRTGKELASAQVISIGEAWTVTRDAAAAGSDDGIYGPGDSSSITPPTTHTISASVFQQRPPTLVIAAAQQYIPDPVWRLLGAAGTDVLAGDIITDGTYRFEVQDLEPTIGLVRAALRVIP